jgi:hypothetical protein
MIHRCEMAIMSAEVVSIRSIIGANWLTTVVMLRTENGDEVQIDEHTLRRALAVIEADRELVKGKTL